MERALGFFIWLSFGDVSIAKVPVFRCQSSEVRDQMAKDE